MKGDNMKLQLSYDKKVVSLTMVDQGKMQVLAWHTKNLRPKDVPQ